MLGINQNNCLYLCRVINKFIVMEQTFKKSLNEYLKGKNNQETLLG